MICINISRCLEHIGEDILEKPRLNYWLRIVVDENFPKLELKTLFKNKLSGENLHFRSGENVTLTKNFLFSGKVSRISD